MLSVSSRTPTALVSLPAEREKEEIELLQLFQIDAMPTISNGEGILRRKNTVYPCACSVVSAHTTRTLEMNEAVCVGSLRKYLIILSALSKHIVQILHLYRHKLLKSYT